jgi:hypothetical protein
MVGLSATGETAVLAPLTAVAYVSLHTADPGVAGANEVAGGAYARQGTVAFANAGSNPTVASNTAIVTFPQATAGWGLITHFGVWTDPSATALANFLGSGALSASATINNGDTARFLVGNLTMTAQ